jgi:hypothetical protein
VTFVTQRDILPQHGNGWYLEELSARMLSVNDVEVLIRIHQIFIDKPIGRMFDSR